MTTQKHPSLITEDNIEGTLIEEGSKETRSCISRTFGATTPGSMRIAIFSMMASAMGTGIFNLPLRIQQVGLAAYIFYVLLSAFFSYSGAKMLARMIKSQGHESYSQMSDTAFGCFLKRLSQFCLIIYPWGIAVCFQVILTKFVLQLLADNFDFNFYDNRQDQVYSSTGNLVRICINLGVIATNFLLIAQKQIGLLQKLSLIGIFSIIFNVCAIFFVFLFGFTRPMPDSTPDLVYHGAFHIDWSQVGWLKLQNAQSLSQHAQALASVLFCFVNHQLVFPISVALNEPNLRRLNKTFFRVNVIEMIVYLIVGCSGYLLLLEHQEHYPIGPMVITSITNWSITVGKVLMVLALYLSIPLNMFPSRNIIYEAFTLQKNNKNHFILSFCLAISSVGIAIAFQKVNSYFGLLGGTAGVLMSGAIPALCYFKLVILGKSQGSLKNYLWELVCLLVTLACFTGAILSVLDPA